MNLMKKVACFTLPLLVVASATAQLLPNDELSVLTRNAEKGDPISQLALADCYGMGRKGAERNMAKTIYWLEKAAKGTNYEISKKAGFQLAMLFTFGLGELERPKDGLYWSEKTYRQGETNAMGMCALNHRRLGNIKMAYQYALAEARWSHDSSKVRKVEAEYEKLLTPAELETCRKEAEALDPMKMMDARNEEVLIKSLKLIAATGDAQSQYELGMHHLKGEMGLPKSREIALGWFRRAAASGHQLAKDKVAELATEK